MTPHDTLTSTRLRMRPDLEEAALERGRAQVTVVALFACGAMFGALGLDYWNQPNPTAEDIVPAVLFLPLVLLFLVWRVKAVAIERIRTRFASFRVELSDEGIRSSGDGERDLFFAWPDVTRVEEDGERGLRLTSRTGMHRLRLYRELERYDWARAVVLERTPVAVPWIGSTQVWLSVLMPVLVMAATITGLVSVSRALVFGSLCCIAGYGLYLHHVLRRPTVQRGYRWTILMLGLAPLLLIVARLIAMRR